MSITDKIYAGMSHGRINTKDITVDPQGQRDVERRTAQFNRIMKNFNRFKVNDLKVARIDNKYFCFDGQMTMKVLKAQNGGRDCEVECKIFDGLTLLEVAELFCDQNENKCPVKIGDILRVKAAYGDEEAIGFMRDTEKACVDISWSGMKSSNAITAISTTFKCYKRFKDKTKYVDMLSVMHQAWNNLPHNLDRSLIQGMTEIFTHYENIDTERMAKQLAKVRPEEILRDAQVDRSVGPRKYAVSILQRYNTGLRQDKRLAYNL